LFRKKNIFKGKQNKTETGSFVMLDGTLDDYIHSNCITVSRIFANKEPHIDADWIYLGEFADIKECNEEIEKIKSGEYIRFRKTVNIY